MGVDAFTGRLFEDVDFLVVAAGTGQRMRADVRKQWLPVCGKPMFFYTVSRLFDFGATSLILAVHPEDVSRAEELTAPLGNRCRIVSGGADRQASVAIGLASTTREFVAIHDAARPFVERDDVLAALRHVRSCGAVTLGTPVRDTLARSGATPEGGCARIVEVLQRSHVWQVQTPQAFRRDLLERAHRAAAASSFHGTDDASLVERLGVAVQVVKGSTWNVKVTEPEDLRFVKLWEALECASD